MFAEKIKYVSGEFQSDISSVVDLKSLEEVRIKYLGKKGYVTHLFEDLKSVPKEEKPQIGQLLNYLSDEINNKLTELKHNFISLLSKEKSYVDLTLPGRQQILGSSHILTQTLNEIKSIFRSLGFSSIEGPELESDFYNFAALNFPIDRPAVTCRILFL